MKKKFNRFWSFAIMLCIVLSVACLIFASALGNLPKPAVEKTIAATPEVSLPPEPDASEEPAATPSPNPIRRSESPAALTQTDPAGADYLDEIYFLGDEGLRALTGLNLLTGENSSQQIWCPGGGTLDLNNLTSATFRSPVTGNDVPAAEIVEVNHPKYVYLLPSSDNANLLTEETLKSTITAFVTRIHVQDPDTKIVISLLTPVSAAYAYEDVTIEVVSRVNGWIAEAAEQNGIKVLDAAFELVGTDGLLPENFTDDGMHLNDEGMKAWFECVKTHQYQ